MPAVGMSPSGFLTYCWTASTFSCSRSYSEMKGVLEEGQIMDHKRSSKIHHPLMSNSAGKGEYG